MADINSSLPVTDTTDGATGSAAPSSAQEVAGKDGSNNLQAVRIGQTAMTSAVSVAVASDQTAIPASQSGTWTVQPGNTQNTTSWLTQDSSDGTVSPGTAAAKSSLAGMVFNTSAPTPTNGQQLALQSDTAGNLKAAIIAEVSSASIVGNGYSVTINTVSCQTAETALILIKNPNGSGKTLFFAAYLLAPDPASANWVKFVTYYDPTITLNGTSHPIINNMAGSANTSIAAAFTLPTLSAFGNSIDINSFGAGGQSYGQVSSETLSPYYIVPPNHSLVITGVSKANNTPCIIALQWFEQ